MDRYFLVILDDLKLWMIHADSLSAQARLSKDNDALAGPDHFLHVMQIEPSTHQRLAQSVCLRFLQRGFKDFFPAAKTTQRSFGHLATKTHRHIAFLARKTRELGAIFVTPRKVREQVFYRLNPEAPQRENFRTRDPS